MPAMIGFDDSSMNAWLAPHLNSVRIPYAAYGQAIVDALAGDAVNPQIVLDHEIIERDTRIGATDR
jgi:LacI family transcriptional regulator